MIWRVLPFVAGMAILTSCGFSRHRVGYYPMEEKELNCSVKIATQAKVNELDKVEVGVLRLGEPPFLVFPWLCSKEDAVKIIREEACNVDADFANIIFEDYPSFMQSCYHCTVFLYRIPDSEQKKLDETITQSRETEPEPDPDFSMVVLGKIVKSLALFGAVLGVGKILSLTRQ